ncbi:hypothetical protein TrLO_g2231 [Triparma laevis f. longispina]|uniref:Uncharacterized protein n=1 Tax=Triparma laevis f. longispina TaxID=1714387 RepID=A0A9W7C892_9STRA|nr:hypothetical protein TrLO_g2231 [Triparma laevis f. longispina]
MRGLRYISRLVLGLSLLFLPLCPRALTFYPRRAVIPSLFGSGLFVPLSASAASPQPSLTQDQSTTTLLRALNAYKSILSSEDPSKLKALKLRIGSYVLFKNALPSGLTMVAVRDYEYSNLYDIQFLKLVGSNFREAITSHGLYFLNPHVDDILYDVASIIEFDGLLSPLDGFPRIPLLVKQMEDDKKIEIVIKSTVRLINDLEKLREEEDEESRVRGEKLVEIYYPNG